MLVLNKKRTNNLLLLLSVLYSILFFAATSTPFTTIHNQFQPLELAIRELEAELDINHSPSDITSATSEYGPYVGSSSKGNKNKKRTIEIAKINLIHHQKEAAKDDINSADDANEITSEDKEYSVKEDSNEAEEVNEEEEESASSETLFEEEVASEADKESEDSDNK